MTKWRVGSKVPINVYEGDRPICQCHSAADAEWIVRAVNAGPVEYPSSPQQVKRDDNWSVKELIETAEKLLEWMPIYSKGSSGNIRQTNLRAAIEKFKVEHPEPAKEGGE